MGCGVDLDPDGDWHADHIVPWAKTHSTNIHEMQALCPPCNLKKGSQMKELSVDWSKMRPGQRDAVAVIQQRIILRERFTAVVLPTRYGKSDVCRVASLRLIHGGLVSAALVMSPNVILRDQMGDTRRFATAFTRYGIPDVPALMKIRTLKTPVARFHANGEVFFSATMQLVNQNTDENRQDVFCSWVRAITRERGTPPVIFVDEAHTGSEDNSWGQTTKKLADAGAYVVLLTATPVRSDGQIIPGFDFEEVGVQDVAYSQIIEEKEATNVIADYAGTRKQVRLIAHHETTFRNAWDQEDPPPICKIGRVPFDVELNKITWQDGDKPEKVLLSELKPYEAFKRIGRIVRERLVIAEGAERLVKVLLHFKTVKPEAAAIVFCGNDSPLDETVNAHAKEITDAIQAAAQRQAVRSLEVIIATSSDGNLGAENVQAFADGRGDVLIVKQMASVGLDVPRLKIALDLSPIRQQASFIQRLTRIGTIWGKLQTGYYISPDDAPGRALFVDLVEKGGGSTGTITDVDVIEFREVPKGDTKPTGADYLVEGTKPADFHDSARNNAQAGLFGTVQDFTEIFPEVRTVLTDAQIANRLVKLPDTKIPARSSQASQAVAVAVVMNTEEEQSRLRQECQRLARSLTQRKLGRNYRGKGDEEFQRRIAEVWNDVKGMAGIPLSIKVPEIVDLTVLERLKKVLRRELGLEAA